MAQLSGVGEPVVLTGGTRGVGQAAALQLAARGLPLVLGARDLERGEATRRAILQLNPDAEVSVLPLDLASLGSVREFAALFADRHEHWRALVLNAGVVLTPQRTLTVDGFESHFGVNHLGHFALAGLMLPLAGIDARVVSVTSIAASMGHLHFHDLRWDHGYRPFRAYAASKRANFIFAGALHRKALAEKLSVRSIATHPGYAVAPDRLRSVRGLLERPIAQDYAAGAAPIVRAVTDQGLQGGELIAPSNRLHTAGSAAPAPVPSFVDDELLGARLWRISGQLTRIPW